MSNSPPSTLGKYQIIREIARSNDIVYEAYDPLMNRRVALKELAMPGGSTPQQREDRINRFKREAQAAGTLNHPNIMTVYEMGQEGDRLYMAMEYLDGHTLRNEIDTRGFLPIERALEVGKEILTGLEHAHKEGVVHRDIKPDNIQILSNGSIKITDFGIARLTFQPNLTMDGQVFGTPSYMSPEQVVGRDIDARSDLFSVGIVLYEMIGGQKPFAGDSVVSITYSIMNKEPERLNQISYPLWQVLARAMDKTPAMRFSSAAEMIAALDDSQRASGPNGVVLAPPVQTPQTTIFGQYPTGMTTGNPYANPYQATPPPMPVPPPVAYPYNPYTQPGQTNMPPHASGFPPGFTQAPIYYPPPPRGPLVKPETKQFLGKLIVSFIVLGSMFALILIGINSLGQALEKTKDQRADSDVVRQLQGIDSQAPVEQQIRQTENLIQRLRGDVQRREALSNLAVLYERQGKEALGRGDLITAENSFQKALDADPENATLYTDLGDLYLRRAQAEQDPTTRTSLWQQSAESWKNAADKEANPERKARYGEATSIAYYNLATQMIRDPSVPKSEVRSALYTAQDYAPSGSEVAGKVMSFLTELQAN